MLSHVKLGQQGVNGGQGIHNLPQQSCSGRVGHIVEIVFRAHQAASNTHRCLVGLPNEVGRSRAVQARVQGLEG